MTGNYTHLSGTDDGRNHPAVVPFLLMGLCRLRGRNHPVSVLLPPPVHLLKRSTRDGHIRLCQTSNRRLGT